MNATVVKSVDTSDLKSDSVMECQFDSGQSHQKAQEILDILQEECAEVIQAISKCRRFGLDNSHKSGLTQRENLTQEVGDLLCMIDLLFAYNIINHQAVQQAKQAKNVKLAKWSKIFD